MNRALRIAAFAFAGIVIVVWSELRKAAFALRVLWEGRKLALSERWGLIQHRRHCSPRKPTLFPEDHGDRIAYRCGLCRFVVDVEMKRR